MKYIKSLIVAFTIVNLAQAQNITLNGQFYEYATYYVSNFDLNTGATNVQIFRYELLKQALEAALMAGVSVTDEASAIESIGLTPRIVQGDKTNIKITHTTDIVLAESIINTLLSK